MFEKAKYTFARLSRRFTLAALDSAKPEKLLAIGQKRLIKAWQNASRVPAYAAILKEHGVNSPDIRSLSDFQRRIPFLDKARVFGENNTEQWCQPGALENLGGIVTSSGQSGKFAFGLSTRAEAAEMPGLIDLGLQQAFDTDNKKTLLINALPMGVRFTSKAVTVAEVSVREDMVIAMIERFGRFYQQIILVTDPLFLKRLLDFAAHKGTELAQHHIHVVIGEETFGENYRAYVHRCLGNDPDAPDAPFVGGSFGVGELGLNLFFETRETVQLKKHCRIDAKLQQDLFGELDPAFSSPMLYAFNPLRTWVEVIEPNAQGYGKIAISLCDNSQLYPLFRYLTGDIGKLIDPSALDGANNAPATGALPLIAILGRDSELLADGHHLLEFKEAIYKLPEVADTLSGAFRLSATDDGQLAIDVQLGANFEPSDLPQERLEEALPGKPRIKVWRFSEFPFGMNLDYERKFSYLKN